MLNCVRPSVVVVVRRPFRRRPRPLSCPPSVVRPVVVVLCPSVPSIRRRRRRRRRPSVVVHLRIQGRMQIFKKLIKIEVPQPWEYEIRNLREKWCRLLGLKLKKVSRKYVLRPKHFCFRILVPMSILTFGK